MFCKSGELFKFAHLGRTSAGFRIFDSFGAVSNCGHYFIGMRNVGVSSIIVTDLHTVCVIRSLLVSFA